MKKLTLFIAIALGLFFVQPPDIAEARRFGGGGSFGSRPSYSQKFSKPANPATSPRQQASPAAPMGGRGMFGGMLGGMLMGGLLGSLFFGGGFQGFNFMDALLIGGGLFLLFRFLRSRQVATQTSGLSGGLHRSSNAAWDTLRTSTPAAGPVLSGPQVPADFDTQDFLAGAKAAYTRLQSAWNARDLHDIRQFTTDEVFQEIQTQAAADSTTDKTEILLLEARLLEVRTMGNQTVASVLFDAMLRENGPSSHAEQVREAWHFSRYESGGKSHWVVEGIQQLEH